MAGKLANIFLVEACICAKLCLSFIVPINKLVPKDGTERVKICLICYEEWGTSFRPTVQQRYSCDWKGPGRPDLSKIQPFAFYSSFFLMKQRSFTSSSKIFQAKIRVKPASTHIIAIFFPVSTMDVTQIWSLKYVANCNILMQVALLQFYVLPLP